MPKRAGNYLTPRSLCKSRLLTNGPLQNKPRPRTKLAAASSMLGKGRRDD
jgi:hypothetical protein